MSNFLFVVALVVWYLSVLALVLAAVFVAVSGHYGWSAVITIVAICVFAAPASLLGDKA